MEASTTSAPTKPTGGVSPSNEHLGAHRAGGGGKHLAGGRRRPTAKGGPPTGPARLTVRAKAVASDYFEMTKPKVQSLLLFTTITTMYVAGDPSVGLVGLTCLGGALSAGGAGAINHYLDRDLDAQMKRTADRPVPAGRVSPRAALLYGIALGAASFVLLALTVNLLAAALALSGLLGYVVVYTLWLKRTTPQNIVIGGAAGAVPPLVAWAATTGSIDGSALYLFAIVFYWTPPHFWALSLLMKDEYAKAGVPMLPVVRGEEETRFQILLYTVLLAAVAALPFAGRLFDGIYMVAALGLSAAFVAMAVRLRRRADRASALRLYLFSLAYLALLFAAMVVDARL
jgi:heme o synthase